MIWKWIISAFPSIVTAALTAYNKTKDVELEKYKVDGTVDVAALQSLTALEQAKVDLLKTEQGNWLTRCIRPLMAFPVIIFLWKVIVLDKVVAPMVGVKWHTDPIDGNVAIWVGIIISGYFVYTTVLDVFRRNK